MERFEGTIEIRLCNVGSRSEGRYAYLVMEDAELTVSRAMEDSYDVPYFEQFSGKKVIVYGTIDHGWLLVDTITEIPEKTGDENILADNNETVQ